jgi:hypothetical protein
MFSLTMDNASVNSAMMRGIAWIMERRYGIKLIPEQSQGRCVAHILNLICQDMLHELKEAEDPKKIDYYYEFHRQDPVHFDENQEPVEGNLGDGGEGDDEVDEEMQDGADAFVQELVQAQEMLRVETAAPAMALQACWIRRWLWRRAR